MRRTKRIVRPVIVEIGGTAVRRRNGLARRMRSIGWNLDGGQTHDQWDSRQKCPSCGPVLHRSRLSLRRGRSDAEPNDEVRQVAGSLRRYRFDRPVCFRHGRRGCLERVEVVGPFISLRRGCRSPREHVSCSSRTLQRGACLPWPSVAEGMAFAGEAPRRPGGWTHNRAGPAPDPRRVSDVRPVDGGPCRSSRPEPSARSGRWR